MTIDEAIEHVEERTCGNNQCAKDHAQLADWLRELRRARMEIDLLKTLRDGFKTDAQKYKAENAKLRMFIDLKETCWKYVGWCAECPYNGIDDEHDNCNCTVQEKIESLARELGIEMDYFC